MESQLLLAPVVLTIAPRLRPLLERHGDALRELGFDLEEFGGDTLHLRACPRCCPGVTRGRAERDPAGPAGARRVQWAVGEPRDRLAATLACHSSVRAGQAMSAATMGALVRDLPHTAHPTLCPHGRPTVVRLDRTR